MVFPSSPGHQVFHRDSQLIPGLLYVWNAINPPDQMDYHYVGSVAEGLALIGQLIREQLARPDVVANAFGLMAWDTDMDPPAWSEWESEDGLSIMDFLDGDSVYD